MGNYFSQLFDLRSILRFTVFYIHPFFFLKKLNFGRDQKNKINSPKPDIFFLILSNLEQQGQRKMQSKQIITNNLQKTFFSWIRANKKAGYTFPSPFNLRQTIFFKKQRR